MESETENQRSEGGEPACWLARVCTECGALTDTDPPTTCPRCQAELT